MLQVARRQHLQVLAAGTVSTNDFKNGMTVEIDGQPFRVMGEPFYRAAGCLAANALLMPPMPEAPAQWM